MELLHLDACRTAHRPEQLLIPGLREVRAYRPGRRELVPALILLRFSRLRREEAVLEVRIDTDAERLTRRKLHEIRTGQTQARRTICHRDARHMEQLLQGAAGFTRRARYPLTRGAERRRMHVELTHQKRDQVLHLERTGDRMGHPVDVILRIPEHRLLARCPHGLPERLRPAQLPAESRDPLPLLRRLLHRRPGIAPGLCLPAEALHRRRALMEVRVLHRTDVRHDLQHLLLRDLDHARELQPALLRAVADEDRVAAGLNHPRAMRCIVVRAEAGECAPVHMEDHRLLLARCEKPRLPERHEPLILLRLNLRALCRRLHACAAVHRRFRQCLRRRIRCRCLRACVTRNRRRLRAGRIDLHDFLSGVWISAILDGHRDVQSIRCGPRCLRRDCKRGVAQAMAEVVARFHPEGIEVTVADIDPLFVA